MGRLTTIKLVTRGEIRIKICGTSNGFFCRKSSCYSKQKVQKNVIKLPGKTGRKTLADRMGIKGKKKELDHADSQSEEYLADNNEDQDTIK